MNRIVSILAAVAGSVVTSATVTLVGIVLFVASGLIVSDQNIATLLGLGGMVLAIAGTIRSVLLARQRLSPA